MFQGEDDGNIDAFDRNRAQDFCHALFSRYICMLGQDMQFESFGVRERAETRGRTF